LYLGFRFLNQSENGDLVYFKKIDMTRVKIVVFFCIAILLNALTIYYGKAVAIAACGIDISAIAIDPKNPEIVYTLCARNGLYKSVDSGDSWNFIVRKSLYVGISIDPENSQRIYVGSHKSINGGKIWNPIRNGLPSHRGISRIKINPHNTEILYALDNILTNAGILYKSIDGGNIWNVLRSAEKLGLCMALAIDANNPNILYGHFERRITDSFLRRQYDHTLGGIYKSVDAGATWTSLLPAIGITALAVDPDNSEIVYAVNVDHGVYRSIDGGKQWHRINHGLPEKVRVSNFAFDPLNSETIYVLTDSGFFKSIDRGYNWRNISNRLNTRVTTMAINPQNSSIMYVGTRGDGILKTTDGGITWHPANNGIPAMPSCSWQSVSRGDDF
jgi:photosystem II stability/assembly factor-like uncharacterized protein